MSHLYRSTTIQLVLVSSLLASCNPGFYPRPPAPATTTDSTATAGNDDVNPDEYYYYDNPFSYFDFNFYIPPNLSTPRYRPRFRRNITFWNHYRFVVKGGFGRAGASTAS